VPQVVTPFSHDQPDQAARIKRLGVGDWLLPTRLGGATLAGRLHSLLDDPAVAARCRELAASIGPTTAPQLIESVVIRHSTPAVAAG
jgi:UDP:flavonoid glycosyltransferase YjiC (YdhE family)